MDQTEQQLVDLALGLSQDQLRARTLDAARLRVVDSIGVALAAMQAPTVQALRRLAAKSQTATGARVWRSGQVVPPDMAALVNGTMVRFLDMNDAYTLTSTAHPSDNIAGLIAQAEVLDLSFGDLLRAVTLSYEAQCRFCDVAPFHQNGWDQPIVGAPAAALAAAKLLGLDGAAMRHALSFAVTPNLPTYQTRRGQLSSWKNMAGPNGARIGLQAAAMASVGLTAPEAAFDGPNGLWQQTLGGAIPLPLPTRFTDHVFAVEQSDIKLFPVRNACQLPVQVAMQARAAVDADQISAITVWTDEHSFGKAARDPALWHPETRESADHSLPFCLAAALIDGGVGLESFESKRFLDNDIRDLMARITIRFDEAYSRAAPQARACRLEIVDVTGRSTVTEVHWPPGSPDRQPDLDRVSGKFRSLAARGMSPDRAEALLHDLAGFDPDRPCRDLVDLLVP